MAHLQDSHHKQLISNLCKENNLQLNETLAWQILKKFFTLFHLNELQLLHLVVGHMTQFEIECRCGGHTVTKKFKTILQILLAKPKLWKKLYFYK